MRLQQTDEGVRFLIEQGKLSPEVRRMIMDAPPGEVIEWNFPKGCVPMARKNEWGGLGGLGVGIGGGLGGLSGPSQVLHITQAGYDQARGLDAQKRAAIQERARQRMAQAAMGPIDPSVKIRIEVEKHLPSRNYSVTIVRDRGLHGYVVNLWRSPVGVKTPALLTTAVVGDYELSLCSWRIKLLEDLDEDLHRRAS